MFERAFGKEGKMPSVWEVWRRTYIRDSAIETAKLLEPEETGAMSGVIEGKALKLWSALTPANRIAGEDVLIW